MSPTLARPSGVLASALAASGVILQAHVARQATKAVWLVGAGIWLLATFAGDGRDR